MKSFVFSALTIFRKVYGGLELKLKKQFYWMTRIVRMRKIKFQSRNRSEEMCIKTAVYSTKLKAVGWYIDKCI